MARSFRLDIHSPLLLVLQGYAVLCSWDQSSFCLSVLLTTSLSCFLGLGPSHWILPLILSWAGNSAFLLPLWQFYPSILPWHWSVIPSLLAHGCGLGIHRQLYLMLSDCLDCQISASSLLNTPWHLLLTRSTRVTVQTVTMSACCVTGHGAKGSTGIISFDLHEDPRK